MEWVKMLWALDTDLHQKSWYTSKTVWFNILKFIAALAALKGFNLDANDIMLVASGITGAVGIYLRVFKTSVPVGTSTVSKEDTKTSGNEVQSGTGNTEIPQIDPSNIMGRTE